MGETLTIFIVPIAGIAIPLLPIHILWINLVTDGLPGLALVTKEPEENIMNRTPRPPRNFICSRIGFKNFIINAGLSIFIQWWALVEGYD